MYGRKKTPHFISKIQLLTFPNLALLLQAQDQSALYDSVLFHTNSNFYITHLLQLGTYLSYYAYQ